MKRLLKYLIIFLVILAILAVILMAVSPKKMVFEESITINAPAKVVYNMVNDFKQWEEWNPWAELDSNAVNTYTDKSAGVGARWEWKGNKEIGEGSQTIKESVPSEKIRTALTFGGFDGEAYSDWNFTPDGKKTKVSWSFDGADTPFVFRPFNLLMKSGLINTYKKGLNKIKIIAEKRANKKTYGGYKVQEIYQGTKNYVMNRQVVDMPNVQNFYTQNISSLFQKAQGIEMEMDGRPSTLFYSWDEKAGKADMAAALPIKTPVNIPGAISQTLSDGKALQVDYYGDPDRAETAHEAIAQYLADHDLLVNYPIVHENVTDVLEEKDPKKWLTKITYYVTNSSQ